jgi:SH3 domain-containing YSC84-like protein 1
VSLAQEKRRGLIMQTRKNPINQILFDSRSRHISCRYFLAAGLMLLASIGWAANNEATDAAKRLAESAKVLDEVMSNPDTAIPNAVIKRAQCVVVFPSVVQAAVLVGGKGGKGFASCRTATGWSAPAPLAIAGGSWGAQLGGESIDLVMIVTDDKGMQQLASGKLNLGVETSVTAGPVGAHHWTMNSEVVTYSRSRGVFAGTNLNGSSISQDQDETRSLYGKTLSLTDILSGKAEVPNAGHEFVSRVTTYAGRTRAAG